MKYRETPCRKQYDNIWKFSKIGKISKFPKADKKFPLKINPLKTHLKILDCALKTHLNVHSAPQLSLEIRKRISYASNSRLYFRLYFGHPWLYFHNLNFYK